MALLFGQAFLDVSTLKPLDLLHVALNDGDGPAARLVSVEEASRWLNSADFFDHHALWKAQWQGMTPTAIVPTGSGLVAVDAPRRWVGHALVALPISLLLPPGWTCESFSSQHLSERPANWEAFGRRLVGFGWVLSKAEKIAWRHHVVRHQEGPGGWLGE